MLRGERASTTLMVLNASDPDGWAPGHGGSPGLYNLLWRLRGELCIVRTSLDTAGGPGGPAGLRAGSPPPGQASSVWAEAALTRLLPRGAERRRLRVVGAAPAARAAAPSPPPPPKPQPPQPPISLDESVFQKVGCTVSVETNTPQPPARDPPGSDRSGGRRRGGEAAGGDVWWRFVCGPILEETGEGKRLRTAGKATTTTTTIATASTPASSSDPATGLNACAPFVQGFPLVVVLERVQSGLLGAALSSIGITGLYISFVFAIGRFLRLSFSNVRQRIPYEEFGSTRRVLAMVQVRAGRVSDCVAVCGLPGVRRFQRPATGLNIFAFVQCGQTSTEI
jgi:hypothetical protein